MSAAIGRPLVGAFARAFYPFPPEVRSSAIYRREFGMQSIVWGVFCFARSAVRLWALLASGAGGLLVVSLLTGTPALVLLVLWGLWHARRAFSAFEPAARQVDVVSSRFTQGNPPKGGDHPPRVRRDTQHG